MTGHETIAARNIKGAFNWIVGGYYNCIQDEEPEALPKSRQELFDEIYSSAFTDKYVCGGCVGKAPDEMRFAGTEFCTAYLNKLLDTDSDVTEIAEVAGWNKKEEKENTMKRFESKRNPGTFIELLKENDKCKTVTVKFEDGKIKDLSSATLKRWYTEVEESSTLQEEKPVEEPVVEENPVEVVTVEPEVEDKPEPKKQTVKKVKVDSEQIGAIKSFIFDMLKDLGADVFVPAKDIKFRSFKVQGKMFASMNYSSKSVIVNCRSKAVASIGITPTSVVHHMFDHHFKFTEFNDTTKSQITQLLTESYKFQLNK